MLQWDLRRLPPLLLCARKKETPRSVLYTCIIRNTSPSARGWSEEWNDNGRLSVFGSANCMRTHHQSFSGDGTGSIRRHRNSLAWLTKSVWHHLKAKYVDSDGGGLKGQRRRCRPKHPSETIASHCFLLFDNRRLAVSQVTCLVALTMAAINGCPWKKWLMGRFRSVGLALEEGDCSVWQMLAHK